MNGLKLDNNWKIIFGLAGLFVLSYVIWIFRSILTYALLAVVISFVGDPLMELLRKIRIKNWTMPSWLRALLTLAVFFSVFFGLLALFAPVILEEIEIITSMDVSQLMTTIEGQFEWLSATANGNGLQTDPTQWKEWLRNSLAEFMSFNWVGGFFSNVVGAVGNFMVGFFAVLFMAFFFLKDGMLFTRIVFTITPDKHIEKMKNILEHSHHLLRRFFVGVCIQSLLMATMIGIGMSVLGVKNAILIGIFAGLVNVIPYLGPLLGATFGIIVAVTTGIYMNPSLDIVSCMIKVGSIFIVAQQIDGFVVQPLVLGNSVKAHPLEIFVVVLAAGTIGGIVGMIIAIPFYTILRVVAREFLSEFKLVESLTRDLSEEKP